MNRVINNPDLVVEEMLQGILAAHPELAAAAGNPRVIKRACAPVAGKVGIVGSSAGGHLAASASTLAETKPAFSILFYPVITAEKGKGHQGSFNALLGDKRSAETDTWYSLQNRVSSETPPTLLLLSDDDRVVPPVNSTLYYNALKDNGVKASMHIYPTGGHGWGMNSRFRYYDDWQKATLDWLSTL